MSWSGAKQHSRRETPLLESLHKIWCNAPRSCTGRQGVEQFFAPGAEWYPSLMRPDRFPLARYLICVINVPTKRLTIGLRVLLLRGEKFQVHKVMRRLSSLYLSKDGIQSYSSNRARQRSIPHFNENYCSSREGPLFQFFCRRERGR